MRNFKQYLSENIPPWETCLPPWEQYPPLPSDFTLMREVDILNYLRGLSKKDLLRFMQEKLSERFGNGTMFDMLNRRFSEYQHGYHYKDEQEAMIKARPDLINKMEHLHPDLVKKYQHEQELGKVDL
jgi:hypothetical protein